MIGVPKRMPYVTGPGPTLTVVNPKLMNGLELKVAVRFRIVAVPTSSSSTASDQGPPRHDPVR